MHLNAVHALFSKKLDLDLDVSWKYEMHCSQRSYVFRLQHGFRKVEALWLKGWMNAFLNPAWSSNFDTKSLSILFRYSFNPCIVIYSFLWTECTMIAGVESKSDIMKHVRTWLNEKLWAEIQSLTYGMNDERFDQELWRLYISTKVDD